MTAEAAKPNTKWLDIANTIILAIASLLTAWNGYEATQWSGVQGEATNAALATRFEATRAAGTGDRRYLIDIIVFSSWLEATRSGDQEMAEFLKTRFREEFVPAFNIWLASQPLTNPDAPSTPFVLPEYMPADLQARRQPGAEGGGSHR